MKKMTVLMALLFTITFAGGAFAVDKGETMLGSLFLFQKCDASLIPSADAENPQYDANGCPTPGNGPWPILSLNKRWGQMRYNLLGESFRFSFQGKRLLAETDYTLIYYPDPWPGSGLICLGAKRTNPNGNIQIQGAVEGLTGLPAAYDKNFNPVEPSGAVGAKIWLVLSSDVQCESSGEIDPETGLNADPAHMLAWNPASYLFEGNMVLFQRISSNEIKEDDSGMSDDFSSKQKRPDSSRTSSPSPGGNSKNKGK